MVIDMTKEINSSIDSIPKLWKNSKHQNWFLNNNYSKGSHGTKAYKKYLESEGYEVVIISDQGDLMYKKPTSDRWIKSEVKASKAKLEYTKNGFLREHLWFNQLRPKQKGWDEVALVGFYPNHIRIWKKTRKDWDTECSTMHSTTKVLEHVGTDELRGVMLLKNTRTNNFSEWDCIHNDQQAGLI